ncbi:MAG: selenoprotein B, partial [Pseudomonadota bacterium]|nr:selenoprotein B [Pseudomonadota bacterium]
MCAISYYLEREGMMTTGISLVRENALSLLPPRSLWVPFPLGRPLGAANNPDFQHRVIAASLDLLNRSNGPVLEDFPEEAPDQDHATAMACPVSFIRPTS